MFNRGGQGNRAATTAEGVTQCAILPPHAQCCTAALLPCLGLQPAPALSSSAEALDHCPLTRFGGTRAAIRTLCSTCLALLPLPCRPRRRLLHLATGALCQCHKSPVRHGPAACIPRPRRRTAHWRCGWQWTACTLCPPCHATRTARARFVVAREERDALLYANKRHEEPTSPSQKGEPTKTMAINEDDDDKPLSVWAETDIARENPFRLGSWPACQSVSPTRFTPAETSKSHLDTAPSRSGWAATTIKRGRAGARHHRDASGVNRPLPE